MKRIIFAATLMLAACAVKQQTDSNTRVPASTTPSMANAQNDHRRTTLSGKTEINYLSVDSRTGAVTTYDPKSYNYVQVSDSVMNELCANHSVNIRIWTGGNVASLQVAVDPKSGTPTTMNINYAMLNKPSAFVFAFSSLFPAHAGMRAAQPWNAKVNFDYSKTSSWTDMTVTSNGQQVKVSANDVLKPVPAAVDMVGDVIHQSDFLNILDACNAGGVWK